MSENGDTEEVPIIKIPNSKRIECLNKIFQDEFHSKPAFVVRVPGRVNIIGEHIDYCGYPVLPMALEQDILIAVGLTNDHRVYLRNSNCKYSSIDFEIKSFDDIDIKPDSNGKPFWYNYVLCGIKGALEYLNNKMKHGLQIVVDGNIPPASGLSSSSALVSAACLAFLHAQNVSLKKTDIADLCAKSERYIGTQGGGMDQAIAFLAEKYCAQYITWQPLKATAVALPEDAAFVVAHSLAEANKAATNDYNRRVIECRLAAKILVLSSGLALNEKILTLSRAQTLINKDLKEMIMLVNKYLPKTEYAKDEICKILNINEEELENTYLTPNTKHLTEFKLKQRALHVYGEALRVEEFRRTCANCVMNGKSADSNGMLNGDSKKNTLIVLGKLMSNSHDSLRNLYECSHDNLDRIVDLSVKMGVHCRLTGAGWGGCVVALCPKNIVNDYMEMLIDEYYVKHFNIEKSKARSYVFATTPNFGASIYL
ncbi:N-acetylgalactosamine kinase [Leptidea sinapis]|uniref:Galactokinase n=1 Tax=Leptidea sinapis TaxID=189913 RepID=A0A5E4QCA1_9NEOP|nr:N-acetylgalactosamine kinase [Leptidea sinapis]VVC95912.1 unnamed protein product [Leptidea sinapis]